MNQNNNSPNESLDSSIEDTQGYSYGHTNASPDPLFHAATTTAASTPSTIEYDMQIEQDISLPSIETMCISGGDDDGASRNKGQQQQQQPQHQMTNTLSQEWLPSATSTPVATTAATTSNTIRRRSEQDIENELFQNIETLVREFLQRPNREYQYYRIIRWTIGEQPKLEYGLTVVINRPAIILE